MKFLVFLVSSCTCLTIVSCDKETPATKAAQSVSAAGSVTHVTDQTSSIQFIDDQVERPLFDEAQKHLRFGGNHYSYTYIGDSLENAAKALDDWFIMPFGENLMNQAGISTNAEKVLTWSGLNEIKATGSSSHNAGKLYEYRRVLVLKNPDAGVFKFLGEPRPTLSSSIFTKDTDFACDFQIDTREADAWLKQLKPMIGEDLYALYIESVLNQGGGGVTIRSTLNHVNLRASIGITLHPEQKVNWASEAEPMITPDLDAIICLEALTENFDLFRVMLTHNEAFEKIEFLDGFEAFKLMVPMELPLKDLQPVIAYDTVANRIYISSRISHLKDTLSSDKKLKDSTAYQIAMQGLPEKVLSTFYFSKSAGDQVNNIFDLLQDQYAEQLSSMAKAGIDQETKGIVDFDTSKITEILNKTKQLRADYIGVPWVSATSLDGSALYSISRTPIDLATVTQISQLLMQGNVAPLIATSALFTGATAYRDGATNSTCIIQQRSAHQAVRSNQLIRDYNVGDPIKLDEIIGLENYLPAMPTCPEGGLYTWSKLIPELGIPAMKCDIENHRYDPGENE